MERSLDRVLAALVAADALGLFPPTFARRRSDHVEVLADVQLDAQLVPQCPDFPRCAMQQQVGVDERKVTDEDRHALPESTTLASKRLGLVLVDEHGVRRRLASTRRRAIHHVVVEQREGVQQLECTTGVDHARRRPVAAGSDEAPVTKRRAQALAAGQHEPADLANRGDQIGVERSPAAGLLVEQPRKTVVDRLGDRSQRSRGRTHTDKATPTGRTPTCRGSTIRPRAHRRLLRCATSPHRFAHDTTR